MRKTPPNLHRKNQYDNRLISSLKNWEKFIKTLKTNFPSLRDSFWTTYLRKRRSREQNISTGGEAKRPKAQPRSKVVHGIRLKKRKKMALTPKKTLERYGRGVRKRKLKVFRKKKAYLAKERGQKFPLRFLRPLLVAILKSKWFGWSHDRIRQRNLCLRTKGAKLVGLICIVSAS